MAKRWRQRQGKIADGQGVLKGAPVRRRRGIVREYDIDSRAHYYYAYFLACGHDLPHPSSLNRQSGGPADIFPME